MQMQRLPFLCMSLLITALVTALAGLAPPSLSFINQASAASPLAARESLKRAFRTGDPFIIEATLQAALARHPEHKAEIKALAAELRGKPPAKEPPPAKKAEPPEKEAPPEAPKLFFVGWGGEVEAGATIRSGNTDRHNALGRFKMERDEANWRTKVTGKLIYANVDGKQTEEEYALSTRLDHKLDDERFYFGQLAVSRDEFSGYEYRITENVGYGHRFKPWPDSELELTGGIGGRHSRQTDGTSENEPVLTASLDFEWDINDGLTFVQTGETTVGPKLTTADTETALKTRLAENWQMKAGFETSYITDVPPRDRKLSTRTAVTLLYGF